MGKEQSAQVAVRHRNTLSNPEQEVRTMGAELSAEEAVRYRYALAKPGTGGAESTNGFWNPGVRRRIVLRG